MTRTEAREFAFKLLYQIEIQKIVNEEMIKTFFDINNIEDKKAEDYIADIANGTNKNSKEIEEIISKNLKTDWKLTRISKVNIALLKLAIYEIQYNELPYKVVINEVVELAKKYGEDTSSTFINGVLASVIKENV